EPDTYIEVGPGAPIVNRELTCGSRPRSRSRPVIGVDGHVFVGEIAGQVVGGGVAGAEIEADGVLGALHDGGGVGLAGRPVFAGDAGLEDGDVADGQGEAAGAKRDAGVAGGGSDAAPVGVAAGDGGLDQGRERDGAGDAAGGVTAAGAGDLDPDDVM